MKEVEGADIGAHVAVFNNIKIRSYKESLNECLDSIIKEKVLVKK